MNIISVYLETLLKLHHNTINTKFCHYFPFSSSKISLLYSKFMHHSTGVSTSNLVEWLDRCHIYTVGVAYRSNIYSMNSNHSIMYETLWNANWVFSSPDLWFQMRTHFLQLMRFICALIIMNILYCALHLSAQGPAAEWRSCASGVTKIHFLRSRKFWPLSTHHQPKLWLHFYNYHNQRSSPFFLWRYRHTNCTMSYKNAITVHVVTSKINKYTKMEHRTVLDNLCRVCSKAAKT